MDVNLVLFKKDGSQKSFSLPSNVTVIGRRHDCDLHIPLMRVSRRHCQLNLNGETVKIRDLGSHNGTYLNGERIDGETPIKAGDYLQVGPLVFQLQIDGKPQKTAPPKEERTKAATQEPVLLAEDDDEMPELEDIDLDEKPGDDDFLAELEKL